MQLLMFMGVMRISADVESWKYIDASGNEQTSTECAVLAGTETTTLAAGWYVVTNNISYTDVVAFGGNTNIILADGATMSIIVNEGENIKGLSAEGNLTIYGQSKGTGKLQVESSIENCSCIEATGNIFLNGGCITVNATGTDGIGIKATTTTLNWSGHSIVFASSYAGTVTIPAGKSFYNGSESLSAGETSVNVDDLTNVNAKSLVPAVTELQLDHDAKNSELISAYGGYETNVKLLNHTLLKDGSWNTLCLPFGLASLTGTPLEGAIVKELDISTEYNSHKTGFENGTLYLNFKAVTSIEARKPFIVKWSKPDNYVAYDGTNASLCSDVVDPTFSSVRVGDTPASEINSEDGFLTFVGSYDLIEIPDEDKTILYLSDDNKLYYPDEAMNIDAFLATFRLNNGVTASSSGSVGDVKKYVLNFGNEEETDAIGDVKSEKANGEEFATAVYDLSGRKINGKPTQKGVYINKGKKVIVGD